MREFVYLHKYSEEKYGRFYNSDKSAPRPLTIRCGNGIIFPHGELSERFKELVLKTSDGETHREFESHTLRQENDRFPQESVVFN